MTNAAAHRPPASVWRRAGAALIMPGGTLLLRTHVAAALQRVVIAYVCLMIIALGIDLIDLRSPPGDIGLVATIGYFAYFVLVKLPENTAQLLGVATFLGLLWWEVQKSRSGARVIVWSVGQSPTRGLATALIVGIVLAPVQLVCDIKLKPAAFELQIDNGLGKLAGWYDRRPYMRTRWVALGDDVMRASIKYDKPATMHDLHYYEFGVDAVLRRVVTASRAQETAQEGMWRLSGMTVVDMTPGLDGRFQPLPEGVASPGKADSELIYLDFDPRLFKFYDIPGQFLSQPMMRRLLKSGQGFMADDYRTWMQFAWARLLFPAAMAALAASGAMFAIGRLAPFHAYFLMLAMGYAAHVTMKVTVTMGELGLLAPIVAAWLGLALIWLAVLILQLRLRGAPIGS